MCLLGELQRQVQVVVRRFPVAAQSQRMGTGKQQARAAMHGQRAGERLLSQPARLLPRAR